MEEQVNQARSIVCDQKIVSNNRSLKLIAKTLCIHGDHPNSLEVAKALTSMLKEENIKIQTNWIVFTDFIFLNFQKTSY